MGLINELVRDLSSIVRAWRLKKGILINLSYQYRRSETLKLPYYGSVRLGIRNAIYREKRIYKDLKSDIWAKWKRKLTKKR